eukprot:COSAG06_NODE_57469_length_280_cov_0.712707_1_plen_38_part_01
MSHAQRLRKSMQHRPRRAGATHDATEVMDLVLTRRCQA